MRLVPPNGDEPILDLCTGTGDLAFAYHKRCGGSAPIIAADFCPEMLLVTEQKKRRRGLKNGQIQFIEADAQELPFSDDHFQIVSVAFGLRMLAVGSIFLALCLVAVPYIWRHSPTGRHLSYTFALALFVGVPVLSMTSVVTFSSRSIASASRIRTPA